MDNLVKARVLKNFTSTALGNLSTGQIVNITPSRLLVWLDQGMVEAVTKEKSEKPEETVVEAVVEKVDTIVEKVKKTFGKKPGKKKK